MWGHAYVWAHMTYTLMHTYVSVFIARLHNYTYVYLCEGIHTYTYMPIQVYTFHIVPTLGYIYMGSKYELCIHICRLNKYVRIPIRNRYS